MTEDEMKQTWCPDARAAAHDGVGAPTLNRGGGGVPDPYCLCLGRQCSAWRWEVVTMGPAIDSDGTYHPTSFVRSTTDGYCGRGGPV